MKQWIFILILCQFLTLLTAIDFKADDELNHNGQYDASLKLLKNAFDDKNPDIRIIWRMSREIFELAEKIPMSRRQEKIAKYTEGMDVAAPYLNVTEGDKRDRANVVFFYAINFGSRGRAIGIIESLNQLPNLRQLADKVLQIDSSLGLAYLLKAKIDEELPGVFGGDKYRMGLNFNLAVKYESTNITVFYDAANAFYDRNWDINKKQKMKQSAGYDEGSPPDMTDRQYAASLLQQAVKIYAGFKNPSERETSQITLVKKLLSRLQ